MFPSYKIFICRRGEKNINLYTSTKLNTVNIYKAAATPNASKTDWYQ